MMKYLLLAAVLFQAAYSKCPNGCNGHGSCNLYDQCTCFNENGEGVLYLVNDANVAAPGGVCHVKDEATCANTNADPEYKCQWDANAGDDGLGECHRIVKDEILSGTQFSEWTGADCSRRTCPRSTSWTEVGGWEDASKTFICSHQVEKECADQGVCDRATGLCECFPGFTGAACQRTACPDDCSGHGTCRSNRDFAYDFAVAKTNQMLQTHESTERFKENYAVTYDDAWDSDHLYGCLCDRGYRGPNCALVECPSANDPLDDKCSDFEDSYTVENFQVQKFAGTGSDGWRQAYVDSEAIEGAADPCAAVTVLNDGGTTCEAVPASASGGYCEFIEAVVEPESPARCVQRGLWTETRPGDKNNHFYDGKVYACFGAMSGMDCSGRGICDYSTGQCACFSGYSGTACSDIEELV